MRILVNAHAMGGAFAGVGRYARSLYRAIEASGRVEVHYFHAGGVTRQRPDARPASQRIPPLARYWLRRIRERLQEHALAQAVQRVRPDVYHETALVPLRPPPGIPMAATVFDLSLLRFPEHHPADRVRFFSRRFPEAIARADGIIAISEFVRRELIALCAVDARRVCAIPLAPDPVFRGRDESAIEQLLATRGMARPYLLAVGTLEPRKNLPAAARAAAALGVPLLVAGRMGWLEPEAMRELREWESGGSVRILGQVSDEDLALLYSGAAALVYPSVYEGFGLPVLEAMACGCPVVASNRASLPEVAGDAAVLVDPGNPPGWTSALERLLADPPFRADLTARGNVRARDFSWDSTASLTMHAFERVLAGTVLDPA